jgi:type II secretory pathway component GspD/PulD (secretin)
MRRIALRTALTLLAALALSGLAAAAAPTSSAEGGQDPLATTITVKWQDSSLKEVFSTIFHAIGADYLLTDEVSGKTITMQTEASAHDILEHVCAAHSLHWWKKGSVYVISSQPAPAETSGASAVADSAPSESQGQSVKKQRFYTTQYVHPRDLASMFNSKEGKSLEGLAWRPELTALFSNQNQTDQFIDTSLQPFGYGRNRLGEAAQYPRSVSPGMNQGAVPLALRDRLLQANPAQARPRTTTLTTPDSAENQDLLEAGGIDITAPFAPLLPSGMNAPIAYEPLNLLIFEATDEAYDRFLELLRIFDQKPKQVILDVQFVTMSTNDLYDLGIDWFYLVGQTALNTTGLAPGAGNFTLSLGKGPNFKAILSTLFSTGRARLVTAPRIATMNNSSASIDFTDEVPYVDFSGATAVPNGGVISGGATVQTRVIPTFLSITPRINADDSVTVLLNPTISSYSLVEVPTSTNGGFIQQVPLVSTSSLSSLLNIKNGETMVIGGFVRTNELTTKNKLPLLSDLPILGDLLFTKTSKSLSDSELLIFVTPHVMKDDTETTTIGPY